MFYCKKSVSEDEANTFIEKMEQQTSLSELFN